MNANDIDKEIERLQKLKLEQKSADEKSIQEFQSKLNLTSPAALFYKCDNIDLFNALFDKYGKQYNYKLIYDRLLDNYYTANPIYKSKHPKRGMDTIILCFHLTISGYFDDELVPRHRNINGYNTTSYPKLQYGKLLFKALMNINDFDRMKLLYNYVLHQCGSQNELKCETNDPYELKIIAKINKKINDELSANKRKNNLQPNNTAEWAILSKKREISKMLLTEADYWNFPTFKFLINEYLTHHPQYDCDGRPHYISLQGLVSHKSYSNKIEQNVEKYLLDAIQLKNSEIVHFIKSFIIPQPNKSGNSSFTPGNCIDEETILFAAIKTNDIKWLQEIVSLFNIKDHHIASCFNQTLYFDNRPCDKIWWSGITLEMYKYISTFSKNWPLENSYLLVKWLYHEAHLSYNPELENMPTVECKVNRPDLADFLISYSNENTD